MKQDSKMLQYFHGFFRTNPLGARSYRLKKAAHHFLEKMKYLREDRFYLITTEYFVLNFFS